jgi:hypothetical protein
MFYLTKDQQSQHFTTCILSPHYPAYHSYCCCSTSVLLDHPVVAFSFKPLLTMNVAAPNRVTNDSSITLSIKNLQRTAINRQQLRRAQPTNSTLKLLGYTMWRLWWTVALGQLSTSMSVPPVSVIPPMLHPHIATVWSQQLAGSLSKTVSSHPVYFLNVCLHFSYNKNLLDKSCVFHASFSF